MFSNGPLRFPPKMPIYRFATVCSCRTNERSGTRREHSKTPSRSQGQCLCPLQSGQPLSDPKKALRYGKGIDACHGGGSQIGSPSHAPGADSFRSGAISGGLAQLRKALDLSIEANQQLELKEYIFPGGTGHCGWENRRGGGQDSRKKTIRRHGPSMPMRSPAPQGIGNCAMLFSSSRASIPKLPLFRLCLSRR